MYEYEKHLGFGMEPFNLSPKQKRQNKVASRDLIQTLREVHCIVVPNDFEERLLSAHYSVSAAQLSISNQAITSVVNACREWAKYLQNPADFDKLVCYEILTLAVSHSCVLSNYFLEKEAFQLVDDKPGYSYATVIDMLGNVKVIR